MNCSSSGGGCGVSSGDAFFSDCKQVGQLSRKGLLESLCETAGFAAEHVKQKDQETATSKKTATKEEYRAQVGAHNSETTERSFQRAGQCIGQPWCTQPAASAEMPCKACWAGCFKAVYSPELKAFVLKLNPYVRLPHSFTCLPHPEH